MVQAMSRPDAAKRTKPAIIDCDVHPEWNSQDEVFPFLSQRWREHLETYGMRGYSGAGYPRFQNRRIDSDPPSGRKSGSDVGFLGQQLLDENNIVYGIMNPLVPIGRQLNAEFEAALATAVNDWLVAEWLDKEPRLRSSIIIPFEHADLAVAEIRRRVADKRFVQVQFSGRPAEPMGRRKYWPIYEICAEHGLAVVSHAFGSGGHPSTGCGWPSYYIEDHVGPAQAMQANIISLVAEGVFERFPSLNVVSAENGFGWATSLMWRLDETWRLLGGEVPHLTRPPSEYVRRNVWFCTQPVEEPDRPREFLQLLNHLGTDRLVYASDYPHWDWDAPEQIFPHGVSDEVRRKVYYENAAALYRLS